MRYRNVQSQGNDFGGNKRPALLGRDVRSRLFVPMDNARLFEQAPLGDKYPTLRTTGESGESVDMPTQPRSEDTVEWELPRPIASMPDTRPPDNEPMDVRIGGKDRPDLAAARSRSTYTVTGTSTTRALNVTSPTAANVAQALNALLADLQVRGILTKV